MFMLRTTADDNDDCGPDFSSCWGSDPSAISDQSSTVSSQSSKVPNNNATTTAGASTDFNEHPRLDVRNFIGVIIAISMIAFGLCLWRVRVLWKTRGREGCCGRKGSEQRKARRQRAQEASHEAMKWTMDANRQGVARPEKALEIGHGKEWKRTSSTPWRDEEQRELSNRSTRRRSLRCSS